MLDDMYCDIEDMERLRKACKKVGGVDCSSCDYANPQAGYDLPYCQKKSKPKRPYRLKIGTIPLKCSLYRSAEIAQRERASRRRMMKALDAYKELSTAEKKKFRAQIRLVRRKR